MEIEFDLTENDILALVRRRQEYSPALRQRVLRLRYGYLVGFSLLGIGSLLISQKLLLFAFFLLAIVSFLLFPAFNDWRLKRSVFLAYQNKNKRATLDKRIMRATNEGLDEISPFGETKVKWMVIDNISVTPTHAFISIDQLPSIVIPKDKVKEKFDEFVQVCQKFQENNSNQETPPNKACTRRWGFWRDFKHFSTPQHFPSRTASPSPAPARVTQTVRRFHIDRITDDTIFTIWLRVASQPEVQP